MIKVNVVRWGVVLFIAVQVIVACASVSISPIQTMTRERAADIARNEVSTREPIFSIDDIEVDAQGQEWSVIVWQRPKSPGAFRIINIDKSGRVTEYRKGL
jgi:hypothetical protein